MLVSGTFHGKFQHKEQGSASQLTLDNFREHEQPLAAPTGNTCGQKGNQNFVLVFSCLSKLEGGERALLSYCPF